MSVFNLPMPFKEKNVSQHPWKRTILDIYSNKVKYAHNSVNNPNYPRKKEKVPDKNRLKITIIGNKTTKEFIYCVYLIKGIHKYRWEYYDTPEIRGVTSVEWPTVWNELKVQYGGLAYCLKSQVAIIINDKLIGGDQELKELIEAKYYYHLVLDYVREGVNQFASFIKSSGRPCAYIHISINDKQIGTLIFMLYADIVPYTCENFLRLCKEKKGGYGGSPIHRIVKDGWIQCGGFNLESTDLNCENFIVPHDRRGVLGMANDGRHVDCSTQFFVLLQPAPWMAHKYVAFGQLIDGEATLKIIENVPTRYESPKEKIIINQAGILNMDCKDITINRNTHEYIQGHIENLYTLGEWLYELLMQKIFLEIESRLLQSLDEMDELLSEEKEEIGDLHATQRFMRKKSEIDKLQKSQVDSKKSKEDTSGSRIENETKIRFDLPKSPKNYEENLDFDVENYEDFNYECEEYQGMYVGTPSVTVKPEKPFYIPLTDVPYPGEVDSTYDLKKFLKGDYCLESDLNSAARKSTIPVSSLSNIISGFLTSDEDLQVGYYYDDESIDSDDEREIETYLQENMDNVSFAFGVIKGIADRCGSNNIMENLEKYELLNDDALRRFRLALSEHHKSLYQKKVSLTINKEKPVSRKIIRRPTGFIHSDDIKNLEKIRILQQRQPQTTGATLVSDDEENTTRRKVRIAPSFMRDRPESTSRTFSRRPTTFTCDYKLVGKQEGNGSSNDDDSGSRKVYIDAGESKAKTASPVSYNQRSRKSESYKESAFVQLLEDANRGNNFSAPTLKTFRPTSEMQQRNVLLTYSPIFPTKSAESSKEKYYPRQSVVRESSSGHLWDIQHGKTFDRKMSSDYFKIMDAEQRTENSIRSLEFAKTRPSLTVTEYQLKNQKYLEKLNADKNNVTNMD